MGHRFCLTPECTIAVTPSPLGELSESPIPVKAAESIAMTPQPMTIVDDYEYNITLSLCILC